MKSEIRKIDIKELLRSKEINRKNYPDALYIDESVLKNRIDFERRFMRSSEWYGLYYDEKLRGVMQVSYKNKEQPLISLLEVNKKYRKRGFGQDFLQLIEELIKKKGINKVCLYPMNDRLIGYYEHLGYEKIRNERKMIKYL